MNCKIFQPTKEKIAISTILTLAFWYFRYRSVENFCARVSCAYQPCTDFIIKILPKCCGCNTIPFFFLDLITTIIFPFAIAYLILSFIFKNK